ncbi:MAG: hypothetical protein A2509_02750 [Candidatus Edwardsbacteria bacterium RIFOXYD12_FULL_50_11]|uniref:Uncharacterized protein n=1 Tax=Candidatus Edwardsbacteria bacterium GWF2_54_11 TaxID=1817851 RepID=A0A1F5RHZ6_9BACT|nr:MAG: hypothetical protein A2502_06615 [Candidatus Edwardsbacteria bacterium RifOxyC12_full_54_24]OGF07031.1 MAG: hypothetical protein A2273_08815 [Candidatus Edwardsbacteria bacterium RifOxyA12_full_54_48]OGF11003.1 MAG: hypothetical protein A3K15_07695 [Candidatus Edwardsbacteria bacterium GWE2_54_12]OGF14095.1 MAG: hypothetical protein A2024_06080 [Candidatus Edwardsbacteria bacterium GWF2_54_11]OGF15949.1 MAG: hypothetical protein A2509_02750 [Candidatus Edwardsbacteria bacterium RIFOXYD1
MDIISIINISLSFVTVIVIIWYTCETRKMQLRIKEQIELSLIPMIDISIKNREIINVGHGTAINIVFTDIIEGDHKVELFDIPQALFSRCSKNFGYNKRHNKNIYVYANRIDEHPMIGLATDDISNPKTITETKISFEDLHNKRYEQILKYDWKTDEINLGYPKLIDIDKI